MRIFQGCPMGERHVRSIRSTVLTLLGYIKEIRSLAGAEDEPYMRVSDRPTPAEAKEIEATLASIEGAIMDYWNSSGLSHDEKDVRWHIYVLAQFMEDLVYDMRPERLNRTHGAIESGAEAERLERLCVELEGHIRRLKELSSK